MKYETELDFTVHDASAVLKRLLENLESVIQGKRDTLELILCCLASAGHVLLEDIPGTGKTTLAKALARSIDGSCKRVQFTPDLLPTDLLGGSVFNPTTGDFTFKPGPIFTNVLVADEINRASSRTQSALLEAMGEQQVTLDGKTRPLHSPFMCVATQNPIDFYGTFQLPEAQLDRFYVRLTLGYVSEADELQLLRTGGALNQLEKLEPVATAEQISSIQKVLQTVKVDESLLKYLLSIVKGTRGAAGIRLGVSTRGSLHLAAMARALAIMRGRDFVIPEDLKYLAVPVLAHRLVSDSQSTNESQQKRITLEEIVDSIKLPR